MVPVRSTAQNHLLETGLKDKVSIQRRNIRMIQRHIRGSSAVPAAAHEPYANWTFLDGAQKAKAILNDQIFSERDAFYFAELIDSCKNTDAIPKAIEDGQLRRDFLDDWNVRDENDEWTSFPASIQAIVREIQRDSSRYKCEQQFLDLLVKPGQSIHLVDI